MGKIGTRYQNIKRYKRIGEVLVKYGFDFLAEKLCEKGYIPKFVLRINRSNKQLTEGERIRLACEELGPTFVKLGQIMSTRSDIFPENIISELSHLQDNVAPFPFEQAKYLLEKELRLSIEEVFSSFSPEPIASASIGQVYEGILQTGESVVVKVQRPGIQRIIELDLDILFHLARLMDEHMDNNKPYQLYEMVEEFSRGLYRELDYTYEARNADRFYENFRGDHGIKIPKIHWDYTTKKVLTMERIYGVKIVDTQTLRQKGWDLKKLADIGTEAFMKQIFIFGFFHGDPHPGNIFAVSEKQIGIIDFGIVGYLDRNIMAMLTDLFTAAARRDVEKIVSSLMEMEALKPETNIRRLKEDISFLLNLYYNLPLKKLNIGEALKELLQVAHKNQLKLPAQLTLLFKSLITLEGSGKYLNPDFSLSMAAKGFVKEIYLYRYHPKQLLEELRGYSEEVLSSLKYLPKQLRVILKKFENNELKVQMVHRGFEELHHTINRATNRISLSMITSALIIGSSLVIYNNAGPKIGGISLFGIAGFLIASFLGFSIIISILFQGRNKK